MSAGVTKQPLLSVILSMSVYLSKYVCLHISPLQIDRRAIAWRLAYVSKMAHSQITDVYVIYIRAHCAGVTNMSHAPPWSHRAVYEILQRQL